MEPIQALHFAKRLQAIGVRYMRRRDPVLTEEFAFTFLPLDVERAERIIAEVKTWPEWRVDWFAKLTAPAKPHAQDAPPPTDCTVCGGRGWTADAKTLKRFGMQPTRQPGEDTPCGLWGNATACDACAAGRIFAREQKDWIGK